MRTALTLLLSFALVAAFTAGCKGSNERAPESQTDRQRGAQSEKERESAKMPDGEDKITGRTELANDKLLNLDSGVLRGYEESAGNVTGIDVTIVSSPDTAAYKTSIQQSIHERSAPGMFTWWGGYQLQTLVDNGLAEDLTQIWKDYITPDGVSSDIAGAFTYDGRIYAPPYSIFYNVILYNKKVFDEAGIRKPETFDDFLAVCEKLKASGVTLGYYLF